MALSTLKLIRGISTAAARYASSSSGLPPAIEAMNQATRHLPQWEKALHHAKHHAPAGSRKWKYISLASVPVMIFFSIKIGHHHMTHEPERMEYHPGITYLWIVRKPFPWRDGKTPLFYNPKVNPIPGIGYEDEQE
ncbi:unnamed protein product [Bemisia tabaci]|uniref:Uncharacterized protein n=1 Tax=Bemisia tabaci TaxID=7038 RepID=A0A9P0A0N4_BEMTA|nr:unnamed protein product [Bemisia tabaci]